MGEDAWLRDMGRGVASGMVGVQSAAAQACHKITKHRTWTSYLTRNFHSFFALSNFRNSVQAAFHFSLNIRIRPSHDKSPPSPAAPP